MGILGSNINIVDGIMCSPNSMCNGGDDNFIFN